MLTCIAIDDEPIALDVVRFHANKVPFLDLKQTFVNAVEALAYLRDNPVDLVFTDINMPDITGLDVARLLPPGESKRQTMFIFTTAYAEHAVKGFELNAVDYLVKPIDFGRFLQAANRANDRYDAETRQAAGQAPDTRKIPQTTLFVKDGYDYVRIDLAELLFVESEGNYLMFYEGDKKVVTRMTIAEGLSQLPASHFMRVHKSYIVNLKHIDKIERHQVLVGDKLPIPLSPGYRDELLARFKQ
ncbi:LytR/AlgR family response regulator transcription factor [Fibrella aquatilis]|uniref:Response regulator transcription factor n=1 Tax=Fibrella aquatilis TaxID=2817059 RepID=A0A939G7Q6_9BACT|nr:LytTR family DNA-binding domain-containing protein [Fibrella aquatilis]MBO0931308.1 response regulator transcription factor [Fibrella aquatilis]